MLFGLAETLLPSRLHVMVKYRFCRTAGRPFQYTATVYSKGTGLEQNKPTGIGFQTLSNRSEIDVNKI